MEGYNHQIPSIAISVSNKASIDFMQIAQIIADNIERLYQSDNLFMYNINFPDEFKDNKIKFVWTKHGRRIYENEFDKVILEDGSTAYKMQGRAKDIGNDECTDIEVVKKGYISITPLQLERTNWQQLTKLQNLGGFFMESMIRDIKLAPTGHDKIAWVKNFMPVLRSLDEEYSKTKPFAGKKVIITMHLEAKTAYLALVFKNAGAEVIATGSNPLSTQDDVVGALVEDGVTVYSWYNCTNEEYDMFIDKALDCNPDMIIDDGGDLVARIHNERPELIDKIIGGSEETTTGVIRLKALAEQGKLKFPMIAANDAYCKFLFDNRYGTGQSTWDGIMRTTNLVIAGKTVVIAGYGWCGKGGAMRAKGLGANVVITEVDPIKAIEAVFDGFRVMPMEEAAKIGDIFLTLTGCDNVINEKHFALMKDGAMMANSGHFDVEINKVDLLKNSLSHRSVRKNIEEYVQKDGRKLYLLAEGRLVNLAAGDGHPAEIMDLSFAVQFFSALHILNHHQEMENKVYLMPEEINTKIAQIKLKALGVELDELTEEQKVYLAKA